MTIKSRLAAVAGPIDVAISINVTKHPENDVLDRGVLKEGVEFVELRVLDLTGGKTRTVEEVRQLLGMDRIRHPTKFTSSQLWIVMLSTKIAAISFFSL